MKDAVKINDKISKCFKSISRKCRFVRCEFNNPTRRIFVLVGPSGSGKTTTLKMINRLIEPTTGEVALNEQAVTNYPLRELRLKLAMFFSKLPYFLT